MIFDRILLAAALAFAVCVHAQNYPVRPIKIIVPNPPGGGNDFAARIVAERRHRVSSSRDERPAAPHYSPESGPQPVDGSPQGKLPLAGFGHGR